MNVANQLDRLSFIRLPIQHHARDLFPPDTETGISVTTRDPFIYNPRLALSSTKSKVCNLRLPWINVNLKIILR